MCAKDYDYMMCSSWDMVHDRWSDRRTEKGIEVGAPSRKETGWQSIMFQWVEYGSFYKLQWKASSLKELKNNNTWNNKVIS